MRPLLPAFVLLSACATTGMPTDRAPGVPHARVVFARLTHDETIRLVPLAIEPLLPSADRISRVIERRLGTEATVKVRYCVSPQGRVTNATLERGSSLDAFNHAVMSDIVHWQFTMRPGPGALRTCQRATIVYRPHR